MQAFNEKVYAVILAGGSGTRFWPKSRLKKPKQLCAIGDSERTMIEITLDRLDGLIPPERRLIVTHKEQIEATKEICGDRCLNYLAEPEAKDTANALALACLELESKDDPIMISLHADHVIQDEKAFQDTLKKAVATAETGYLSLFAIEAKYPETGYGYMEKAQAIGEFSYKVASFREKPDLETAKDYLSKGNFYWNAGIFAWKNSVLISELEERLPANMRFLREALEAHASYSDVASEVLASSYRKLNKISIDHAILEVSENVACIPCDIGWQDVGSWDALSRCFSTNEQGNLIYGDSIAFETKNTTIDNSESSKLVATIGLNDMVVVNTKEAILVCPKDRAQDVKKMVAILESEDRKDLI